MKSHTALISLISGGDDDTICSNIVIRYGPKLDCDFHDDCHPSLTNIHYDGGPPLAASAVLSLTQHCYHR